MKVLIWRKNLAILLCFILIFASLFGCLSVSAQSSGGPLENGIYTEQSDCYNVNKQSLPVNLNLAEGFKYWTSNSNCSGYASDFMSITTDPISGGYMVGTKSGALEGSGISTVGFKTGDCTKFALIFKVKVNPKLTDTVYNTYGSNSPISVHLIDATTNSALTSYQSFGSLSANTANGGWITYFVFETTVKANTYYAIELRQQVSASAISGACQGESPYWFKDFCIVSVNKDGSYTDLSAKKILYKYGQTAGGTETDGVSRVYTSSGWVYPGMYSDPDRTVEYFSINGMENGDFSLGFKYWSLKNDSYGKTTDDGSLTVERISDIAEVSDGVVTFKSFAAVSNKNLGIQTVPFNLSGYTLKGDKIYFTIDHKNETPLRFRVCSANGDVTKENVTSRQWNTTYLNPITVNNAKASYAFEVQSYQNIGGSQFKNVKILRTDRGGLEGAPLVNVDGRLLSNSLYGDANNDGRVDLKDLVRMKKHISFISSDTKIPIFLCAADINATNSVDAEDTVYIINYILKNEVIPEHNGVIVVSPDSGDDDYVELPDIEF